MADTANAPAPTFPQSGQQNYKLVAWTLNGVSTGVPVRIANWSDKMFQVYDGSWGSATCVLEGSIDPTADPAHADYATSTWGTLTNSAQTAISTAVDLKPTEVLQNPLWIRPKTTGGTGTTVYAVIGGHQ